MLFFFGVFSAALISGVCFCRRLLSYCDGDPSKPHLNLRGKHLLLLFCIICPCFWENCVPKMDLSRAIFSRLGDCFGTPLLWRFLLVSIHNYDWQIFWGWNCRIGIVTDWVFSVLVFLLFAFFCRICWTHLVNEDSKIVVKYSSETAQINQSFCIKQKKSCFCHSWEPESGIYLWSELALSFIHHFWS